MRVLVTEAVTTTPEAATSGTAARAASIEERFPADELERVAPAEDEGLAHLQSGGRYEVCTVTCTVAREEAWLFEATRCLLEQVGARGADAQVDALLAEAQGTLLGLLPVGTLARERVQGGDLAQRRWEQELRRWRDEAEASCEKNVVADLLSARARSRPAERLISVVLAAARGIAPLEHASCAALDQQVRALRAVLARHELELSRLVLRLHRANGWRRLGYATETQYARERLGLSRSSLLGRRALALRLETLPGVAAALGAAQIGVEAALQIVRIATPNTEAAWVERGRSNKPW